jgi:hypothetical protein
VTLPAQRAIITQWEAIMPNHTRRPSKVERVGFVALAWALAVIVYGGALVAVVIAVEWAFVP